MPNGLRACLRAAPFQRAAWSAARRARRGTRRGAAGRRRRRRVHCARAGQGAGPRQSALHARKARLTPKRGQELSVKKRDAARAPTARPPRAHRAALAAIQAKAAARGGALAQKCPRLPLIPRKCMAGAGFRRCARRRQRRPYCSVKPVAAHTHTRARARAHAHTPPRARPRRAAIPALARFRSRNPSGVGHGPGRIGTMGARRNSATFMHGARGRVHAARLCELCDDPKDVQRHGEEGRYEPRRNRPAARFAR